MLFAQVKLGRVIKRGQYKSNKNISYVVMDAYLDGQISTIPIRLLLSGSTNSELWANVKPGKRIFISKAVPYGYEEGRAIFATNLGETYPLWDAYYDVQVMDGLVIKEKPGETVMEFGYDDEEQKEQTDQQDQVERPNESAAPDNPFPKSKDPMINSVAQKMIGSQEDIPL